MNTAPRHVIFPTGATGIATLGETVRTVKVDFRVRIVRIETLRTA